MNPAKAPAVVVEFATGTSLYRETDRPSQLPIVRNGPPGTFVLFPAGLRVSVPTDQVVAADDHDGHARIEFGGMALVRADDDHLLFRRVRELRREDELSPERSYVMRLDVTWVRAIFVEGVSVWQAQR